MEGGNKKRATRELATISLIACIIVETRSSVDQNQIRKELVTVKSALIMAVFVGVKRAQRGLN